MAVMDRDDLLQLPRAELIELRQTLEEVIAQTEAEAREKAKEEMLLAAKERGFTIADLFPGANDKPTKKKSGAGVAPLRAMRHPDDPEKVYRGRGKHPAWLAEWLADGHEYKDLVPVEA